STGAAGAMEPADPALIVGTAAGVGEPTGVMVAVASAATAATADAAKTGATPPTSTPTSDASATRLSSAAHKRVAVSRTLRFMPRVSPRAPRAHDQARCAMPSVYRCAPTPVNHAGPLTARR